MPHWVVLLAIVVAGWLALAVIGGTVLGRWLGALEHRRAYDVDELVETESEELRRAA